MIYLKSYPISNIVLMFIIFNNSYAEQMSCATKLINSEFISYCHNDLHQCWIEAIHMSTTEIDKYIGIQRQFIMFLKNQKKYNIKTMNVYVWCDKEQPKTCEDSFSNFYFDIPSIKEFREMSKTITDYKKYNSVVQRYLEYVNKFPNLRVLTFLDWCEKHENMCIESIRMEGFEIETYSKPEDPEVVNLRNWKRANNMREVDIPKSGFAADYIQFVRSTTRKNFDTFVTTWCFSKCYEYMTNEGYNDETKFKIKKKENLLPNDTSNKFYSCALKFVDYCLSTSNKGNNFGNKCLKLCIFDPYDVNRGESVIVDSWCENECL